MRTLEEYMKLPYRMEITEDPYEGGYVVSFPELPGCFGSGETINEAVEDSYEAKELWFEAMIEDGMPIQEPKCLDNLNDYSGQFKLRMPKSLHRTLAERSKKEGISMNQYCVYLLSRNEALTERAN